MRGFPSARLAARSAQLVLVATVCVLGLAPGSPVRVEAASATSESEAEWYGGLILEEEPVGYWRLGDESNQSVAEDASGNDYDGAFGSEVSPAAAGIFEDDDAFEFAGSPTDDLEDRAVIVDEVTAFSFEGDFTVEAWVKTTGGDPLDNYYGQTIVATDAQFDRGWRVWVDGPAGDPGRVMAHLHGSSGADYYGPEIDVNDGEWHHVAVVFDRDYGAIVYVDGEEEQTAGVVEDTTPNASDLMIGSDAIVPSPFAGSIDELAVYDYALSEEDIDRHIGGPSCEDLPQEPTVTLFAPTSLHANGADLDWSPYVETCNPQFGGYQVHRSRSEDFTPSAATLIAEIEEIEVTAYRDTTAAADTTFYYKVVAGEDASEEHEVTLPEAGMSTRLIQPGPGEGRDATIRLSKSSLNCNNEGASTELAVGSTASAITRSLVRFDLRDVPTGASVEDATLSLWHPDELEHAGTVRVHRVTRDWREGPGDGTNGSCLGKGATWYEANGGVPWAEGGAFDSSLVDDLAASASEPAGWHSFDLSGLAQEWVNADHPNFGVLVKLASETPGTSCGTGQCAHWSYTAIDGPPAERPTLELVYEDETAAVIAPRVGVALPRAGSTVSGTEVPLAAAAGDDGRVTQVQFKIGSTIVATDDLAPFTASWNSNGVADGSHEARAVATDDAGNTTTSDPITFTVDNSDQPSASLDSPSAAYTFSTGEDESAGHWRLGETDSFSLVSEAADESGNARTGSYAGSFTSGATGLLANDADLATVFHDDATDGEVSVTSFTLGAAFSVEAWVDYAALQSNSTCNRLVRRNWGALGGWALSVCRSATGQQEAHWALEDTSLVTVAAPVTPGPLHLVGTYDGSDLRLYVDGAEVASEALSATADESEPLLLAGELAGDVTLDEVAVYDSALNAQRIKAHYDAGLGRGATVAGTTTLAASASDDGSIDRVEFYVDEVLVGSDESAPFSVEWEPLEEGQPFYDGEHALSVRAYSDTGQMTSSEPVPLMVGNASASVYQAEITTSEIPFRIGYDPEAQTQETHTIEVTVKNTGTGTLSATGTEVRYDWYEAPNPGEEPALIAGDAVELGTTLAGGQTTMVELDVEPPELPDAAQSAKYILRVDLVETGTSTRFSAQGNPPEENPVQIAKALRTALGLERYYQYASEDLGGGMTHLVNVANGNGVVRWTPFSAPGRGLSSVVDLTYNSLEKRCDCVAGNNVSLAISSLTRIDEPLDIHPNGQNRFVRFTDGDGTTHEFSGTVIDNVVHWQEPPGVNLYLRRFSTQDENRAWALTRPDRVTFFYNEDGYPTYVRDRNGNELAFTLEPPPHGEPQNIKWRVTAITDARGRSFQIAYYTKADRNSPQGGGKIKTITDHTGSELFLEYFDDGNLMRITQRGGGTDIEFAQIPDRRWIFSYVSKSDPTAPVVATYAGRANPDPRTNNQAHAIYSVIDPNGGETTFTYHTGPVSTDKWELASRTNRAGEQTLFLYDDENRITTVKEPLDPQAPSYRVSEYHYDVDGSTTTFVDPAERETTFTWSVDRKLIRVDEPGGAYSEYAYNANGYLTDQKILLDRHGAGAGDDELAHTKLEYDDLPVDGNDLGDHLSELTALTRPNGTATETPADDYRWQFAYDEDGNLETVTDGEGGITAYDWNLAGLNLGTLAQVTDANDHATSFDSYDENGLPTAVTDAAGNTTTFEYTDDGLLRTVKDPNHAGQTSGDERTYKTVFDYDSFHRLQATSTPKTTNEVVWTAVEYDANDNVLAELGPISAGTSFTGAGPRSESVYDEMDRPVLLTGPDRSHDGGNVERTRLVYDAAGRLAKATRPLGVPQGVAPFTDATPNDYSSVFVYDLLDRIVTQVEHPEAASSDDPRATHFCYDLPGNLISITRPKADLAEPECGDPETEFTTRFTYDDAGRRLTTSDAEGRASSVVYDANGNVLESTDPEGLTSTDTFDELDRLTERRQPFITEEFPAGTSEDERDLLTRYDYDAVGNLIELASPRAFDDEGILGENYVTTHEYDDANRLVKTLLPVDGTYTDQLYVYRAYDANGNLRLTSLETDKDLDLAIDDPFLELEPEERTEVGYYKDGTVRVTDDPGGTVAATDKVFFDTVYRAGGRVECRLPGRPVDCDDRIAGEQHNRRFDPDGQLVEVLDKNDGRALYGYDLNNNLTAARDTRVTEATRTHRLEAEWDGFDQLAKARQKAEGDPAWRFTTYLYDPNGNVDERLENAEEGDPGLPGRLHEFAYDQADWLERQIDRGETGASDDRKIKTDYFDNGWPHLQTVKRDSAGWVTKKTTEFERFATGQIVHLETRNGASTVLEEHLISYLDDAGRYVNGHRTRDEFTLEGPDETKCEACVTTFAYDPRERLVEESSNQSGDPVTTTYELDPHGNVECETRNSDPTGYEYLGNQLRVTRNACDGGGSVVRRNVYDAEGNLDCVVSDAWSSETDCPAPGAASLQADYTYDYQNRLEAWRSFTGGTEQDVSRFEYDALGRPLEQRQRKTNSGAWRFTALTYVGLTETVSQEQQFEGENGGGDRITTKTYSYDPFGQRVGLDNDPGPGAVSGSANAAAGEFTYGYDAHGSVTLLIDEQDGGVQASYGYAAYGKPVDQLTEEDSTTEPTAGQAPDGQLNAYRYTGKRLDAVSDSYDMGFRRYHGTNGRFLQQDLYLGALADLSLTLDPLTGNRYAFAGGSPVLYVETDGHKFDAEGGHECKNVDCVRAGDESFWDKERKTGLAALGDITAGVATGFVKRIPETGAAIKESLVWHFDRDNPCGIHNRLDSLGHLGSCMGNEAREGAVNLVQGTWQTVQDLTSGDPEKVGGALFNVAALLGIKRAVPSRTAAPAAKVPAQGDDLLKPGPWAKESVPSSGPGKITQAERDALNPIGEKFGCHSCGARSPGTKGNWIGDHQPVSRTVPPGTPQRLFPHCQACSNEQGLWIINMLRRGDL